MIPSGVLVVDDDEAVAALVAAKLTAAGIACDTACSAEAAVRQVKQKVYSIVVADIHMPGMSGVELITALKQYSPLVQVLMRTADASMGTVIECADRGAVDFFSKEDDLALLVEAVRAARERVRRWIRLMGVRAGECAAPLPAG